MTRERKGYTLVELLIVMLLLALAATGAMLRLVSPLRHAQFARAIQQLQAFDSSARATSQRKLRADRVEFHLDDQTFAVQGPSERDVLSTGRLPTGIAITHLITADGTYTTGRVELPLRIDGASGTYALRVVGQEQQSRWLLFIGGSGQSQVLAGDQEATVNALFHQLRGVSRAPAPSPNGDRVL